MQEKNTLRNGSFIYFVALAVAALAALSSSLGLLPYLFFALYAALACAVLFRLYHPAAAAVAPILSFLVMGACSGFSLATLVLSLFPAAVGLSMALGVRGGEARLSLTFSAMAPAALVLLAFLLASMIEGAAAAGATDLLAYAKEAYAALCDELVALQLESNAEVAKLLEAYKIPYALPTETEVAAMVSQLLSLMPGAFLALLFALSLLLTYGLQLLATLLGEPRLFDDRHKSYAVGAFVASVYLIVSVITLFYTDYASPFYLVCINTSWVLVLPLAFAALLQVPRLVRFIRRMSYSSFDFAVWMILLVLCVLFYFSRLFTLLAVWQALHILISILRARKHDGNA